jgi:hypothetical protein
MNTFDNVCKRTGNCGLIFIANRNLGRVSKYVHLINLGPSRNQFMISRKTKCVCKETLHIKLPIVIKNNKEPLAYVYVIRHGPHRKL